MTKAGLLPVGQLSFRSDGGVGLAPFEQLERAQAGAALLGIPLIEIVLAPCWHCGGATDKYSTTVDADCLLRPLLVGMHVLAAHRIADRFGTSLHILADNDFLDHSCSLLDHRLSFGTAYATSARVKRLGERTQ